jgi:hypothetical protein
MDLNAPIVPGIAEWARIVVTATSGQISFTLPSVALDPETYTMSVNGVEYARGIDYVVSGTTLTWLSPFTLMVGDQVIIAYER